MTSILSQMYLFSSDMVKLTVLSQQSDRVYMCVRCDIVRVCNMLCINMYGIVFCMCAICGVVYMRVYPIFLPYFPIQYLFSWSNGSMAPVIGIFNGVNP